MKSAKKAKTFTLIGVISAAVFLFIYILFILLMVALNANNTSVDETYY